MGEEKLCCVRIIVQAKLAFSYCGKQHYQAQQLSCQVMTELSKFQTNTQTTWNPLNLRIEVVQ